jgi:hypothetical protein
MTSVRSLGWLLLLVLHPVLGADLPSPESWFGHTVGADRTLLEWRRVVEYFQALDQVDERVRVDVLGRSTEGRPLIAVFLASADTIRNLDRYRQIQERLADPRRTPEGEAGPLIEDGKTVVMITCSIHSTEVGSTMTAVEYAYRLLAGNTSKNRTILDNTIFILVPSLNPDGVDLVYRWYNKTLGTPFEGTSPPELYQKYIGHDNNRDWYIFSQAETRLVVSRLHNVWHPQIVYDVHQQGPNASRMFVPPWMDPVDPNIDPIIVQLCNAVGATIAADLTARGKTGVVINAMYDFWTPGRHYQAYHGGLRILTESASAKLATPVTIKPDEIREAALGYDPKQPSWNHLEPWLGGEWRVRDIIDYQLIAWESVLHQAAVRRAEFLQAFYRVGQRAVSRTEPYAFIVPAVQRDPGAARVLLETLRFGQVEIERAGASFLAGGNEYPAGTYVIRMQQPYGAFAKTLLEPQRYPELRQYPGGPPKRPYDVTAHTLPLLMGVEVHQMRDRFDAALAPVMRFELSSGLSKTSLSASDTDTWRKVTEAWNLGRHVWRDMATGDFHFQPGSGLKRFKQPRIGLYRSYMPAMDEGWTRWLLEHFGFAYKSVFNPDIWPGRLRRDFDVIVFPSQGEAAIHSGYKPGAMPVDLTGGVGDVGAQALKEFVRSGGTLLFFNASSEYALEWLGLNARDVLDKTSSAEFYAPGSLLNVKFARHPLTLGVPEEQAVWFESGPAFRIPQGSAGRVVGVYPEQGILASGWLLGGEKLAGRAAVVELPVGRGRAVLFGIRPQYRAQSYATFKLFFNGLLLHE